MLYSRSSNSYHVPRPPPTTPEYALERPQTCMVVTTREKRIDEALHRAKTPLTPRRRRIYPSDENGKNLYILTREYPSKFTTDVMEGLYKEYSAARKEAQGKGQECNTAVGTTTNLPKHVVKERVPTPWKPATTEKRSSSNSDEEAECRPTVITNSSNLQREPSVVSTHHVLREYSFRRSSRGSTNEILVTSKQEFCCVSQQPDCFNDDVRMGQSSTNTATEDAEGRMTSDWRRQSFDGVEAPTCCQGQNNNRFNINIKHKANDPFQNGPGIVREKTIIATTITSPRTPLRRVKLDLESDSSNIVLQYPIIGDDFSTYPRDLILSDDEDYCSNVSADDEDTISEDDPEISSLTYPSSVGSAHDCFEKSDRIRGLFSTPSRLFRNIKEFFTRNSKSGRNSRIKMVDSNNQKEEYTRLCDVQSAPPGLMREYTTMPSYVGQGTFSNTIPPVPPAERIDTVRTPGFAEEDLAIEEEIVDAMPPEPSQDDGILSVADTVSQGGRSSAMSPGLESAPPSALKKRGSASRSGSVKKQKVQFDMDVEVHLVPRDAYDKPDAKRDFNDRFDSIYDGQQLEDDRSSQISNDINDGEEEAQCRESNHISNAGKIRQHGPSVPFRVIKRETPTGGGRRGRRNSYDLIQKTITRQFRNQAVSDADRRHSRQHTTKAPLSPPRTPHTSYYQSRENRPGGEDQRLLARANAVSPDHFVAFYNKQQQLKQYLDHERRLRRQQLFNGNMKYQERQRRLERANGNKAANVDDDSDTDSGASVGERLPRVHNNVYDPPLPQPIPYVQREPAGGRRRFLTEEERSRVSSGYGGSASEIDGASLHSMMAQQQSHKQPFTQRQVAEVMRAAGINKGRSPYLDDPGIYEEPRIALSARYTPRRHDKAASDGGTTYTRLSQKAKQALQQAQMTYTSSLNEMMPVGKGYPGATEPKEQSRLSASQRGYPLVGSSTQFPSRYLPGQSKGRIPGDGLIRNQSIVGSGYRAGSAYASPSSGYAGQYPIPPDGNRPGTSPEAIFVDMLGLSARLPLNARRRPTVNRQRSNASYSTSQPVIHQNSRSSVDPYRRLTSGNKSPYLKSQLPDEWTRNKPRHSFSEQDYSKYRTVFNHAPSSQSSSKPRNPEYLRSGPPQLRRKRLSYTASDPGAEYSRRIAPRMMA